MKVKFSKAVTWSIMWYPFELSESEHLGGNEWKIGLKFNADQTWDGVTEERPVGQFSYSGTGENHPIVISGRLLQCSNFKFIHKMIRSFIF